MNDAKVLTKSDLRLIDRLLAAVSDLAARCGSNGATPMPRVRRRRRAKAKAAKPAPTKRAARRGSLEAHNDDSYINN